MHYLTWRLIVYLALLNAWKIWKLASLKLTSPFLNLRTLAGFQGLLRQNTAGMDMVMETAQALSETLNSL